MSFVIRLRNDKCIVSQETSERPYRTWMPFAKLFEKSTDVAQCLGVARPYASSQHARDYRLVLGSKPRKAELRKKYADDYERKRACEPLLLATSLDNDAAASIVRIYNARMQIEETFRDTKNARFGWGLSYAKTSSPRRAEVLLMLVALAFAVVTLVGAAAREAGLDPRFRARSGNAPVLSVFKLGALVLAATTRIRLPFHAVWRQLKRVRLFNRAFFPSIKPPRSENRNVPLPLPHVLFCVDCGWNGAALGWPA